ncbi:MAG: glycosyltransferase, partial [Planctomycetales bacterium]|nr:glycosyltransferase [Planctomycetales bacterium]
MKLAVVDANAYWTEQLYSQCARFAEVLLVKPRDFRAHRAQTGSLRSDGGPIEKGARLWEQRLAMPPGWMVTLWPLAERRLSRVIRRFAGGESLVLVITYPQYRGLLKSLHPVLGVYYNCDDYRDHWKRYRQQVPRWEKETVETADATICIAKHRANRLSQDHPDASGRIHHLPIGVTPEFLADPAPHAGPTDPPARATAGYIGALNYRFDFGLVAESAARLPHVQFVLGGQVQEDGDPAWRRGLRRARNTPNIQFIGWVKHESLSRELAAFDVLLMPYSHCNFNTNACPAKLWDYLSTGKPIVANDANPETLMFREVVHVGDTPTAFAAAIRHALEHPDEPARERRLEIAREHTWEKL